VPRAKRGENAPSNPLPLMARPNIKARDDECHRLAHIGEAVGDQMVAITRHEERGSRLVELPCQERRRMPTRADLVHGVAADDGVIDLMPRFAQKRAHVANVGFSRGPDEKRVSAHALTPRPAAPRLSSAAKRPIMERRRSAPVGADRDQGAKIARRIALGFAASIVTALADAAACAN